MRPVCCGPLAIRFDGVIRDGVITNQAELARLGHGTRTRMTQIMGPLQLAPRIQEAIPRLPADESRDDVVTERDLREFVAELDRDEQRKRRGRSRGRISPLAYAIVAAPSSTYAIAPDIEAKIGHNVVSLVTSRIVCIESDTWQNAMRPRDACD